MFSNVLEQEALENKIRKALEHIERAVGYTYGPNGSNVTYIDSETRHPKPTKDGKTVLMNLCYQDEVMNTVLNYMVNSAITQEKEVGDGTTTLTLVTCELYRRVADYIKEKKLQKSVAMKIFTQVNSVLSAFIQSSAKPMIEENDVDRMREQLNIRLLAYTATDGDAELSQTITDIFMNSQKPKVAINYSTEDKHVYKKTVGVDIGGQVIFKDQVFDGHHLKRIDSGVSVILCRGPFAPSYEKFSELTFQLRANDQRLVVVCNDVGDDVRRFMIGADSIKTGLTGNIFFIALNTIEEEEFTNLGSLFSAKTIQSQDLSAVQNDVFVDFILDSSAHADSAIIGTKGISLYGTKRDEEVISRIIQDYEAKIQEVIDEQGETPQSLPIINMLKAKINKFSRDFVQLFVGGETEAMTRYNIALADDAIRSIENAYEHGIVDGMNYSILSITDDLLVDVIGENIPYREQIFDFIKIIRSAYETVTKRLALDVDQAEGLIEKIVNKDVVNLRFGDEKIPVRNCAYTDLVILSNAADNIIFFMMSAFLGTRPDIAME